MFDQVFDMTKPIYAIYSAFDLGAHVEKMRTKYPNWTNAQLRNIRHWQRSANKALRERIAEFIKAYRKDGFFATTNGEGMGVNVTETMKNAGIVLEWGPKIKTVYKIAFAGVPINDEYFNILI